MYNNSELRSNSPTVLWHAGCSLCCLTAECFFHRSSICPTISQLNTGDRECILCFERRLDESLSLSYSFLAHTTGHFRLWPPHVCSSTSSTLSWFNPTDTQWELPALICLCVAGVTSHMSQFKFRTSLPPAVWTGQSCQHTVRQQHSFQ
jgi:hypothetical protein